MIKKWFSEFTRSRTSTNDAERSGRPKDVNNFINHRKNLEHRLHEDLDMRKLTAKQVPRLVTIDQNRQRVRDSKSSLNFFNLNPSDLLRQLVTIDET